MPLRKRDTRVKKKPLDREIVKVCKRVLSHKGLKPEIKFFDTLLGLTAITQAGLFQSICLVSQGLQYFNRVGNRIAIMQVSAKVFYYTVGTGTPNTIPDVASLGLLVDGDPDGLAPPALYSAFNTDNTQTPFIGALGANPYGALLFPNPLQSKRYRYLWHMNSNSKEIGSLVPDTYANGNYKQTSTVQGVFSYDKKYKKPIEVVYDDNNGNLADLSKNNIVFYAGSLNAGTSSIQGIFRIYYTDL